VTDKTESEMLTPLLMWSNGKWLALECKESEVK